ncbi:hypothetical protein BDR07DRAFT_430954 [Suillus spraguei]|nr:hypothetical protein BDR07DRAFT_430954 [Suillus spraguei]
MVTAIPQFYFLLCWHTIGWAMEGVVDARIVFSNIVIRTRGVPHQGDTTFDSDQRQRRTFITVLYTSVRYVGMLSSVYIFNKTLALC